MSPFFLKHLVEKQPEIIFKGGTSLSKCYKLINRFSEDIDLNLEYETRPTNGKRRNLKMNIISTINDFGFELKNLDNIRSRRDFNKYIIKFPSTFDFISIKQDLIVETAFFLRSYPIRRMEATSLIYEYLRQENRMDIISQFCLEPFELNVQKVERTFIDKLFAICDYYLDNKVVEHSRHVYDLYKLFDMLEINDSLKELYKLVRKERSEHSTCYSAQENVNIKDLLKKIVDKKIYKNDYETITLNLLYEDVSYNEAVNVLQKIINSGLLDSNV